MGGAGRGNVGLQKPADLRLTLPLLNEGGAHVREGLDDDRALGPLRAPSAEALGVPDCCPVGTALAEAVRPILEVLGAGSTGSGCSGAASALGSGQGGACGSSSAGALYGSISVGALYGSSSASALGSGAGVGPGASGHPWSPAASLGGLKANKDTLPCRPWSLGSSAWDLASAEEPITGGGPASALAIDPLERRPWSPGSRAPDLASFVDPALDDWPPWPPSFAPPTDGRCRGGDGNDKDVSWGTKAQGHFPLSPGAAGPLLAALPPPA
ncbi:uncharacterized protein LOC133898692 [Phragmites australis]|uniref:uncharacterized protein LOC133898692 n=1 Tax=Phragmites australis TaxID=29695 RepID=UPI002D78C6B0|nr:uncharacterized protein LOC133898692 [Phragmites australis]